MPFTFSHPVLVLPLLPLPKKWVSVTGLIIGSIVPDFEKFMKMRAGHSFSHTLAGVLLFDLPLALILSFVFHGVVRDKLTSHLPAFLRARFARFRSFEWKVHFINYYPQIIISILIGAFSHLFLDGFTHHEGMFVQLIPFLNNYLIVGGIYIYHHKLLDSIISTAGGLLICYAITRMPAGAIPSPNRRQTSRFWLCVICLSTAIILVRVCFFYSIRHIWDLANIAIAALLISVLIAALCLKRNDIF